MSRPLDGAWAKVRWAQERMDALKADIALTPDHAKSVPLVQEFDPHANVIEVKVLDVPDLPVRWGLMAADVFQNLRAALNYLAWELGKWNVKQHGLQEPDKETQFPISTSSFAAHRVKSLHPNHRALLELLQPYGDLYI